MCRVLEVVVLDSQKESANGKLRGKEGPAPRKKGVGGEKKGVQPKKKGMKTRLPVNPFGRQGRKFTG